MSDDLEEFRQVLYKDLGIDTEEGDEDIEEFKRKLLQDIENNG